MKNLECDVLVLGAGPGGYAAAFRAADLGLKTILVEREPTLGGVCLNVGCIPSKALLHTAHILQEARARARKVQVVTGTGSFVNTHHLEAETQDGTTRIQFRQAIIAAGSEPVKLPFLPIDSRIVDSTGALELPCQPERMLVIGGGIIGLEMATVYAALGTQVDVVERQDGLMMGADRDLVNVWQSFYRQRFANLMLNTQTVQAEAKDEGIHIRFEGVAAPSQLQRYDLVLVAVGRTPNGAAIGADKAGVRVTERGLIEVDHQQRTNVPHIYAVGDIVGQPML